MNAKKRHNLDLSIQILCLSQRSCVSLLLWKQWTLKVDLRRCGVTDSSKESPRVIASSEGSRGVIDTSEESCEVHISYFSFCCDKMPWPKQPKGERGHSLKFGGIVHHGGDPWQQELEVASHTMSTVRNQGKRMYLVCAQFRTPAHWTCCPLLGQGFLPQLTYSRRSLTGTWRLVP